MPKEWSEGEKKENDLIQSLELKETLEMVRTQLYHLINEVAQVPEKPRDVSKNTEEEGSAIRGGGGGWADYAGLAFGVRKSMFEFCLFYLLAL